MRYETREGNSRKSNLKTNFYVDGNTVRRLEGEPEERRRKKIEKEKEEKRKQQSNAAKRNQERAMHINFGYVLFCTLAVLLIAGVCVTYIRLNSDITSRTKSISKLEGQIADLRAENDAALKRIDLSTDLDAVKEKALEYGMKYAKEGQIIYYTIEDSDFMEQYSDIPKK